MLNKISESEYESESTLKYSYRIICGVWVINGSHSNFQSVTLLKCEIYQLQHSLSLVDIISCRQYQSDQTL